jgi:hypothetical protein
MTNAIKVLLQMPSGFLQFESTLGIAFFATITINTYINSQRIQGQDSFKVISSTD